MGVVARDLLNPRGVLIHACPCLLIVAHFEREALSAFHRASIRGLPALHELVDLLEVFVLLDLLFRERTVLLDLLEDD